LDTYRFSERVSLTFHERQLAVLALEGPQSLALAASLGIPAARLAGTGNHVSGQLGGIPARIIRCSLAGVTGIWCAVDSGRLEECWTMLLDRGGSSGLQAAGWEALNAARIEAGEPWFGIDMDESTLLPETGLERLAASDSKGCYVGQEIVARMETYGSASKRLMGLLIEGTQAPQAGDRVLKDGADAGWVTSAAYSPTLKRAIAMGYVKRGAYEPGTRVEVAREDAKLPATVKTLGQWDK
jgi:aminomethyltransferase